MYAVKELSCGRNALTADRWARLRHLGMYLVGAGHFVQRLVKLHDKHKTLDINTYIDPDWIVLTPIVAPQASRSLC